MISATIRMAVGLCLIAAVLCGCRASTEGARPGSARRSKNVDAETKQEPREGPTPELQGPVAQEESEVISGAALELKRLSVRSCILEQVTKDRQLFSGGAEVELRYTGDRDKPFELANLRGSTALAGPPDGKLFAIIRVQFRSTAEYVLKPDTDVVFLNSRGEATNGFVYMNEGFEDVPEVLIKGWAQGEGLGTTIFANREQDLRFLFAVDEGSIDGAQIQIHGTPFPLGHGGP